jgi:hypothetical protein
MSPNQTMIINMNNNSNNDERYSFRKEYALKHECCPKCGYDYCMTTLIGYILDLDHKDEYKDRNLCTCNKCEDKHIMHDRVPRLELNIPPIAITKNK